MTFIHKKKTVLITTKNGSSVSQNGSHIDIVLGENALHFDKQAKNIKMSAIEAFVYNVIPNIIEGTNNTLDLNTGGTSYRLVFPTGLYSGISIGDTLKTLLQAEGLPEDIIELIPNSSLGKMVLNINAQNTSVLFAAHQGNTQSVFPPVTHLGQILGFGTTTYSTTTTSTSVIAPNEASLNQNQYFLLHCDIVNNGVLINNVYNQTLAVIGIDSDVGNQIHYKPHNVQYHSIDNLHGSQKNNLSFWLTDEYNNPIVMNKDWSVLVQFEWDEFIV